MLIKNTEIRADENGWYTDTSLNTYTQFAYLFCMPKANLYI